MLEGLPVGQIQAWRAPSGVEIAAVARTCQGAAGPDGWSGAELRGLPLPVFEVFAQLAARWMKAGKVPGQMCESRMVSIPKPGKVSPGNVIPVQHLTHHYSQQLVASLE